MGARINYVFKDSEDGPSVVLYSHWGQDGWETDIAYALEHAKPRWNDAAYGTRMMISYLMQGSILEDTGFGIYAINGNNYDLGEQTVVIDFVNKTVTDNVPVDWIKFVQAYKPVLAEAGAQVSLASQGVQGLATLRPQHFFGTMNREENYVQKAYQ